MTRKHFIGIPDTVYDNMNNTSNYYLTTKKDASISVEEETIPLNLLQSYISSTQTDLANLTNRVGNLEYNVHLTTALNPNLSVQTTTSQIVFDTQLSNIGNLEVTPSGTIKSNLDGVYFGNLTLHFESVSAPSIWVWFEKKPAATGVWEKYGLLATNFFISDSIAHINVSGIPIGLLTNDEIKVNIVKESAVGTATLVTNTLNIDTETLTQYAAVLNVYKI